VKKAGVEQKRAVKQVAYISDGIHMGLKWRGLVKACRPIMPLRGFWLCYRKSGLLGLTR
jgi:hypothetical protein